MGYMEPGVYSKTILNRPKQPMGGPSLIPLVIGSGAAKLIRTEIITRGKSENTDTLPFEAVEIKCVGFKPNKSNFTEKVDYKLNDKDKTKIEWLTDLGAQKPKEGEKYAVTFTYKAGEEQFAPRLIETLSDLEAAYGKDIDADGEINNLVTAASVMLKSGASPIYVLQVPQNERGKVTSNEYQKALEEHAMFIEDIWRIIPVDEGSDINAVIDGHIALCSSYEERKERCAIYTFEGGSKLKTADEVIERVGGYASSKKNSRVTVAYPNSAIMTFSDGVDREVGGPIVAAAIAGAESSQPLYMSRTKSTFGSFKKLLGVKMTRVQKNKLAENGVLILEQPKGEGTDISIRHQLTTDVSSVQTKEMSILASRDFTAKYIRSCVEDYIGRYNITPDMITKVRGSVISGLSFLKSNNWIVDGQLTTIAQDEDNPDTLLITMEVKVPYPCNYIKILIVAD